MIRSKKSLLCWISIALLLCGVLLYLFLVNPVIKEPFEKRKKKIIGKGKIVKHTFTRPVFPHPALPLRVHNSTWIVKVPLTPFKAPLVLLPQGKPLPSFLLYKPELLTPVRNQGDCGSCWAFSVCDILSDRLMIQTGAIFDQNISVQQLLACFAPDGCDGGSPEDAVMWLAKTQYPLMSSRYMPYTSQDGGFVTTTCPAKLKGAKIRVEEDSVRSIVTFIDEVNPDPVLLKQNILNMKRALMDSGPFYCAVTVYEDLFTFSGTKVYAHAKGADQVGGHAIEVIGYADKGVDPRPGFNETGYWVCRNSWGKDWPTESTTVGYFAIEMGTNMCGIESRCGYATPLLETSFTPSELQQALSLDRLRYTNIKDYLD